MAPRTIALLLILGCGPAPSPPVAPSPAEATPDACRINPGGATNGDTVRVASAGPEAERLISRQRHVPLVRLDCEGRLRPGLATTWSSDTSHRIWTLELDSTLEATRVIMEWQSRPLTGAALQSAGVQAVQPLDSHRISVTVRDPFDSPPTVFADPLFALDRPEMPPVFQPLPTAGDARDALDRGADLLETADPSLLEYAARNPEFLVTPLPWTTTYVLLIPHGSAAFQSLVEGDSIVFRKSLASDVVQGEAREALPPFWWEALTCGSRPRLSPGIRAKATVLYSKNDPVARSLAERVVALSAAAGASARGADSAALLQALTTAQESAFVLALPRIALVPCRETGGWPAGATVVPLVETRSRLIVRRKVPPLEVEWDGTVRPVPAP